MATKNLARTVVEGGRTVENRCERRQSHRSARVSERAFVRAILCDLEVAEARSPAPLRRIWKEFRDRLGPVDRWLRTHAGQRWDTVYSEFVGRYDTRTLRGRHLLEHVISSVQVYPFKINELGILREPQWSLGYRRSPGNRRCDDNREASEFVGGRVVGARGGTMFWFVATFAGGELTGRFRQDRRLTKTDAQRWRAFSVEARNKFSLDFQRSALSG